MKLKNSENLKWSDYNQLYEDEMWCRKKHQNLPKLFPLKSLRSGKKWNHRHRRETEELKFQKKKKTVIPVKPRKANGMT